MKTSWHGARNPSRDYGHLIPYETEYYRHNDIHREDGPAEDWHFYLKGWYHMPSQYSKSLYSLLRRRIQ
jgi:hypothetical protein